MIGITDKVRDLLKDKEKIEVGEIIKNAEIKEEDVLILLSYMRKKNEIKIFIEKFSKNKRKSGEMADKVWRAIRILKRFTVYDVVKITGVKLEVVRSYLFRLKTKGIIVKAGKQRARYVYVLKKDSVDRPSFTEAKGK